MNQDEKNQMHYEAYLVVHMDTDSNSGSSKVKHALPICRNRNG
jgi:hypothetical protein